MSLSTADALTSIERAFPRETIVMDRAFSDWGRTYMDTRAYKEFAHGRTWDVLDRSFLERRDDALGFLGTEALAAILPAALSALLGPGSPDRPFPYALAVVLKRPVSGRDDGLGHRRFDALLGRLSAAQQHAVAAALQCFVMTHPGAGSTEHLRAALDSYWGGLATP